MNNKLVWFGLLTLFFGGMMFLYFQYQNLVAENNRLYFDSQKQLEDLALDTSTDLNKWLTCKATWFIPFPGVEELEKDCGLSELNEKKKIWSDTPDCGFRECGLSERGLGN